MRARAAALALGLLAATRAADAQVNPHAPSTDDDRMLTPCVRALPPEQFRRMTVFLEADVAEGRPRDVLPVGDLLVQLVTARIRARLDAQPDSVPAGDAMLAWHEVDEWLVVRLRRDGTFTWWPRGADGASRTPTGGAALLARALEEIVAESQQLYWPPGLTGDSAEFELHLHHPYAREDGAVEPMTLRMAAPLVTLPVPPMSAVRPDRAVPAAYPSSAQNGGVEGFVVLQFVVDQNGRVELPTVRDVWPSDRPRLTGDLLRYYEEFQNATVRGLRRATYVPARVGGCAVPQLVQQAFEFKMSR